MIKRVKFHSILMVVIGIALACQGASAEIVYTSDFSIFTDNANGGGDPSSGYLNNPAVKFRMEIRNGGPSTSFKIFNDSTIQSSITGVFFMDGTLLGIDTVLNGPGVAYNFPSNQNNLPNGNDAPGSPFITTIGFSADADPPSFSNGVNDGLFVGEAEWVEINFRLELPGTLEDIINELNNGQLRVGIHIQGFTDGSSQSALSGPAVPEPATICLLGMGGLALLRRRKA